VTENAAISAIEHVASVATLIIKLVIGTSCRLRLRAPIQWNVITPACIPEKAFRKRKSGVTARLSHAGNVRNGSKGDTGLQLG
jgi:hypothetical protein